MQLWMGCPTEFFQMKKNLYLNSRNLSIHYFVGWRNVLFVYFFVAVIVLMRLTVYGIHLYAEISLRSPRQMDISPDGSIYAQRYKVYDYPHVGIIDPRTGRLMWKKEGWTQQNPLTAEQFAEYAMDFCSRNSFDRPPQAPRPPGSGNAAAKPKPQKRSMHEMTEDEQLQAAMRASLEESGGGDATVESDYEMDSDDDDVVIVDPSGQKIDDDSKPKATETKEDANAPAPAPAPQAPASMLDELISFDIGDEPEKGARIQFRMPDGKRKIRKFDTSSSVRHVYAFVAVSWKLLCMRC